MLRRSDGVLALFDYDEADSVNPDVKPDRWKPSRVGAEPDRATVELRRDLRIDVCGVFGVPAALLFPDAGQAGTGVIELRRSWLRGAVGPLLADFAAQMAGPLDAPDLAFTLPALAADTADAESRATMRRAQAARALTDAGWSQAGRGNARGPVVAFLMPSGREEGPRTADRMVEREALRATRALAIRAGIPDRQTHPARGILANRIAKKS